MKLQDIFNDDRAVSPVIGVILMVAITVILAAVIGSFVLGLGSQVQQTTPNVNIGFDYTPGDRDVDVDGTTDKETVPADSLDVTHETGSELSGSQVSLAISGHEAHADTDGATEAVVLEDSSTRTSDAQWPGSVSAGSSVTIDYEDFGIAADGTGNDSKNLDLSSATVRVTWTSETGEQSATLAKWSGPDA